MRGVETSAQDYWKFGILIAILLAVTLVALMTTIAAFSKLFDDVSWLRERAEKEDAKEKEKPLK